MKILRTVFILLCATGLSHAEAQAGRQGHRLYYDSGAVKAELPVRDGRLEGAAKWYYESGAVGAVLDYRNNRLHGISKVYYENGRIKKIMPMENNRPSGITEVYSVDGTLRERLFFEKGTLKAGWYYGENGEAVFCSEAAGEQASSLMPFKAGASIA